MKLQPLTKLLVGSACLFTGASLGAALGDGTYAIIANGIASVTAGNVANAIDALTNGSIEDISLENQDLVKAIGRAIGKIIADIANNKIYQKYKSNLLKIAKNAEENWLIIAEKSDLSSNDVPSYIQQNFHDIQKSPLDLEEWKYIFIRLNLRTFPNGGAAFPAELITHIAEILQQVFSHALTEVLKYDFVHDGKAYAGLTLRLLTDIKASLDFSQNGEILAKLEELITGLQQNPEEVFRKVSEQIEVGFTTVIDKLDTVEEKIDYIIEKLDNSQVNEDNLRGIPSLDVFLVSGKHDEIVEKQINCKLINAQIPMDNDFPVYGRFNPIAGTTMKVLIPDYNTNHDYYREWAKYLQASSRVDRFKISVKNSGSIAARDVKVIFDIVNGEKILIVREMYEPPHEPFTTQLAKGIFYREMLDKRRNKVPDISVKSTSKGWRVTFNLGKIQPQDIINTVDYFYFGSLTSKSVQIFTQIFSDDLPEPKKEMLEIRFEVEDRVYLVDEIVKEANLNSHRP